METENPSLNRREEMGGIGYRWLAVASIYPTVYLKKEGRKEREKNIYIKEHIGGYFYLF